MYARWKSSQLGTRRKDNVGWLMLTCATHPLVSLDLYWHAGLQQHVHVGRPQEVAEEQAPGDCDSAWQGETQTFLWATWDWHTQRVWGTTTIRPQPQPQGCTQIGTHVWAWQGVGQSGMHT